MFESIMNFFKKMTKKEEQTLKSKDAAKERLHLVLMQDRANVSADFLDLMKQEIIEVIKKYIDIDESAMDVRLTNKENEDGSNGAPALYANIPILNIKDEVRQTAQVENDNKQNDNKPKANKNNEKKQANPKQENKKQENKTKNSEKEEQNKEQDVKDKEEKPKKEERPKEETKEKKENKNLTKKE